MVGNVKFISYSNIVSEASSSFLFRILLAALNRLLMSPQMRTSYNKC